MLRAEIDNFDDNRQWQQNMSEGPTQPTMASLKPYTSILATGHDAVQMALGAMK